METLHSGRTNKLFTRLAVYPAEEALENMNTIAKFNLRSPLSLIQLGFVLFGRSLNISIGGSFSNVSAFVAMLYALANIGLPRKSEVEPYRLNSTPCCYTSYLILKVYSLGEQEINSILLTQ